MINFFIISKYLPVYQPNEEEKRNATVFARNVRSKMAE